MPRLLFIFILLKSTMVWADVRSTSSPLKFDRNGDGNAEMVLTNVGLGIGNSSPSANLQVSGNAIISDELKLGSAVSGSNLNISGSMAMGVKVISADATLDQSSINLVDTSAGNISLDLPYAGNVAGRVVTIKRMDSLNTIWLSGGGNNIEDYVVLEIPSGSSSLASLKLVSDGQAWYILKSSTTLGEIGSDNFILWWKCDDTGSVAVDSSGHGRNGTIVAATSTAGQIDGGFNFDGNNDYIVGDDINELELAELTFSFWAKLNTKVMDQEFISKGEHNQSRPLIIWFDVGVGGAADVGSGSQRTLCVLSYDGSTQHWVGGTNEALNNTNWNHIAVVLKPSTGKIATYINGVLNRSHTKAWNGIQANAEQLRIAVDNTLDNDLNGAMDDIRIYNRELTADEISALFRSGL